MQTIIHNHSVELGGILLDLPRRPVDATVRVWAVPVEYVATGYFVSTQGPGEPLVLPACAAQDATLLVVADLPADPDVQLADLRRRLQAQVAAHRWAAQTRGVQVGEYVYHSDAEGRASIAEALRLAELTGEGFTVKWKTAGRFDDPGQVFVTLSAADLREIALAIGAHVAGCFAKEATVRAALNAAQTATELQQVFAAALAEAWPV